VKSFSPYKNARYSGFHLLSLVPPQSVINRSSAPSTHTHTFTDSPCFLPAQTSMYTPLSMLTLLILAVTTLRQRRLRYAPLLPSDMTHRGKRSPSPVSRKERGPMSPFSISLAPSWSHNEDRPSLRPKGPDNKKYSATRWMVQFMSEIVNSFLIIILPALVLWTLIAWTCR
jgi:hypothetical protein